MRAVFRLAGGALAPPCAGKPWEGRRMKPESALGASWRQGRAVTLYGKAGLAGAGGLEPPTSGSRDQRSGH